MILIISEENDKVTDNAIDWLVAGSKPFTRLSYPQRSSLRKFEIDDNRENIAVSGKDKTVDSDQISCVWHRRALIRVIDDIPTQIESELLRFELNSFLIDEQAIVAQAMETVLEHKCMYYGSYTKSTTVNKLKNLLLAKKAGLKIPRTLITTEKAEALSFVKNCGICITKNLDEGANILVDNLSIRSGMTTIVTCEQIEHYEDDFAPTLFQTYIEKAFEIRVFFFDKMFFPMAIFSQSDSETAVDYRNYNNEKPNRNVPIILPRQLTEHLEKFILSCGLTTGSFDLVYTRNAEYVFLEVNPVGQFHWLSEECNYYIEKEIANKLPSC